MAVFARHNQLSPNTVLTVTLTGTMGDIEILNRTGTDEIFFTAGAAPPDPTIGGDDCYIVPATIGSYTIEEPVGVEVIKLITATTQKFSVLSTTGDD